jgi:hypothetical protein
MSQILNILRKDIRGLRVEILLVLAGTITFVWISGRPWPLIEKASSEWRGSPLYGMQDQAWLPLLWWLLIARLVHQENLVGDRQFWTTRPYSWKSLVAEKALFIILFVVVPGALADGVLLGVAGFSPWAYVPQLLGHLGMITLLMLLPALAIAAVTRNLAQFVVAGSCFLSFWVTVIRPQPEALVWFRFGFILAIGIAAALAVIFLQYARRRTAAARSLMIGAVAAAVIASVIPLPDALVHLRYPAGKTALNLTFDPDPTRMETATYSPLSDQIPLDFPLQMEGLPDGSEIISDGVRLHIEAPDGKVWDSGWLMGGFGHAGSQASIGASMDRNHLDALKWVPLKVRVTIVMTMLQSRYGSRFSVSNVPFVIPGVGHCWYRSSQPKIWNPPLECLAPFHIPYPFMVRVEKFGPDCITTYGEIPPKLREQIQDRLIPESRLEIGIQPSYLANMKLDPVAAGSIRSPLSSYYGEFTWRVNGTGCPGSEMVIGVLRPVRRFRRDVEISGIRLADYIPRNAR